MLKNRYLTKYVLEDLAERKEPKLYLWDWSEISDEPVRFENCVASHLLKLIH